MNSKAVGPATRITRAISGAKTSLGDTAPLAADLLEGAEDIAAFLGAKWNAPRVRAAKHRGSLPIRTRPGMGLYALKSELRAFLADNEALPKNLRPAGTRDT